MGSTQRNSKDRLYGLEREKLKMTTGRKDGTGQGTEYTRERSLNGLGNGRGIKG